jgi:hypothetical protein
MKIRQQFIIYCGFQNICCLIDKKENLLAQKYHYRNLPMTPEILQKVSYDYNILTDFPVKGRHWRKSTRDRWGTIRFSKNCENHQRRKPFQKIIHILISKTVPVTWKSSCRSGDERKNDYIRKVREKTEK